MVLGCAAAFPVCDTSNNTDRLSQVSIIANMADNKTLRDPRFFVYDTDTDMVTFYDFRWAVPCPAPVANRFLNLLDLVCRADKCTPESHTWDGEDPRLVACETMAVGGKASDLAAPKHGDNMYDIATLFATPNDGILLQEFHKPKPHQVWQHGGGKTASPPLHAAPHGTLWGSRVPTGF